MSKSHTDNIKKAAVLGFPVRHSKSPLIQNYWIEKLGVSGQYDAHEVHPELFTKERLLEFVDEGYCGFNLTIPLKELGMDVCDAVDETAKKIGAVNVIHVADRKLIGTNTDSFGFIRSIKEQVPDYDFKARPAMVMGAGGAARAAVHGLLEEGVPEIRVFNRTMNRAEDLAHHCIDPSRVQVHEWSRRNAKAGNSGLIINTTPLGMKRWEPLVMDFRQLPQDAIAYDMIYSPLQTRFLEDAEKAGLQTISGIHMLLQQARPAFKLWFGKMPEVDEELLELVCA